MGLPSAHILLILSDVTTGQLLENGALIPEGYSVSMVSDRKAAETYLQQNPTDLIILSDMLDHDDILEFAETLFEHYPLIPVVLLLSHSSITTAIETMRRGFADYLPTPVQAAEVQSVVRSALKRRQRLQEIIRLEARRDTKTLRHRVNGLETIQRIGRQVTSLLELDDILTAVVEAAVELTMAEEGSLLLLDETSGELYMRAGKNFQEDFVRTFRLPVTDSLAGQVLLTGKPMLISEKTPKKIKTSYLVHNIIYTPLQIHGRTIGVLEVDNRQSGRPFTDYHLTLVSALADYAAIAIENARLYAISESERGKLETILSGIEEGVLVIDQDQRVLLLNGKAREMFGVDVQAVIGRRVHEVIDHQELLEVLNGTDRISPSRLELTLRDGRVVNAQLTPIPEIGFAVTMQDISHLKELDRIKSDFVNTVSHDLRSPLTAILGYVELLERVGTVNEQQKEFIRRVQISVHNITELINDLLELGRIEAGFDMRNEVIPFSPIIQYAVEGLRSRALEKSLNLDVEIPEDLPAVLGNPVQLRQMLNNLLINAIKYTPSGRRILVHAFTEGGQVIIQIVDNGPGIPLSDQPYIFDRFYRASNVPADVPGTGLGLAIVKSIVESHLGRIWVDSTPGIGTTFTIVLPAIKQEL